MFRTKKMSRVPGLDVLISSRNISSFEISPWSSQRLAQQSQLHYNHNLQLWLLVICSTPQRICDEIMESDGDCCLGLGPVHPPLLCSASIKRVRFHQGNKVAKPWGEKQPWVSKDELHQSTLGTARRKRRFRNQKAQSCRVFLQA